MRIGGFIPVFPYFVSAVALDYKKSCLIGIVRRNDSHLNRRFFIFFLEENHVSFQGGISCRPCQISRVFFSYFDKFLLPFGGIRLLRKQTGFFHSRIVHAETDKSRIPVCVQVSCKMPVTRIPLMDSSCPDRIIRRAFFITNLRTRRVRQIFSPVSAPLFPCIHLIPGCRIFHIRICIHVALVRMYMFFFSANQFFFITVVCVRVAFAFFLSAQKTFRNRIACIRMRMANRFFLTAEKTFRSRITCIRMRMAFRNSRFRSLFARFASRRFLLAADQLFWRTALVCMRMAFDFFLSAV